MIPQSVRARAGIPLEVVHVAKILKVCPRMVRWFVATRQLPERRRGLKILVFDYDEVTAFKLHRDLERMGR